MNAGLEEQVYMPKQDEKAARDRKAILVLGMHRSGTSALTRVLNLYGAALPRRIMAPDPNNEKGYWEPEAIVTIHDELLSAAGSSWDDVLDFPAAWFSSEIAQTFAIRLLEVLREEYAVAKLFVVKDPRINRLLPFWLPLLEEFNVEPSCAIIVRNPLEVAASLKARDGFEQPKSMLLWLRHFLAAERCSRGIKRAFVNYDELLSDWRGVVHRLGTELEVTWPGQSYYRSAEVDRFLSTRLRHHSIATNELVERTDISEWVKVAFEWAVRAAGGMASEPAELDAVSEALQTAELSFAPLIAMSEVKASRLSVDINRLTTHLVERDGQIGSLNEAVAERDGQIAKFHRELTKLHRELTKRDEKIVGLNRTVAAEDAKLRAMRSSTSWRVTAPLRFVKTAASNLHLRRRLRKAVSITATSLYRALPLSVGRKVKVKGWLFGSFPFLFGQTSAYRNWVALMARNAADDTSPVFTNVLVPPSNDTAGRSGGGARPPPPKALSRQLGGTSAIKSASLPKPVIYADFNAEYYLKRYPDVAEAGIDPYQHFITYGKAQGRSGCPPKLILHERWQSLHTEKEYVLVVTHEATRTGAAILAWNLCCELKARFNVVALLLGGGDIAKFFYESCDVVVGPYGPMDRDPIAQSHVINDLRRRYNIKFAIVNSIASRSVLRPLANKGVPSVLLIHEFYEFHCSPADFVSALTWAGDVVFSASIVQQSASLERTKLAVASSHVLPQGKSRIPTEAQTTTAIEEDIARITRTLMIEDRVNKPFVVLGVGTVEYRKGVDLFIATATEIMRLAPESNVVMVWVGSIVDSYLQYAAFIREQAERSGLGDRFKLVSETPHLQAMYDIADLCFISSRLDPLPNVAIEAMTAGTPVLCFDKATGVAEILASDAETSACVLPFLSVEAAARTIVEFYRSPKYTASMSEHVRLLAKARFDMESYVGKLVDLAANVAADLRQQECDVAALQDSDDFLVDFYLPRASTFTRKNVIRRFVKSCQSRIYIRKPAPGFDPQRYARHHDLTPRRVNPFVHFIKAGKPAGPWQETVINLADDIPCPNERLRVAVHVHAFYPDLLTNIIRRLASNESSCDLFISVTSEGAAREVRTMLQEYQRGSYEVRKVPNRGRDIGPLATEFATELMDYDVIGHFHTKKSVHVVGSNLVQDWADFLSENLLGGKYCATDKILSMFGQDAMLGLVFADDPHLIGWDKNRMYAERLSRRIGIDSLPEQFFPFPIGTMFWARPQALKPLFDLRLGWDEYPEEPLPIDGSMLHALERLLPVVVESAGFGRMVTYAPGVTR